MASGESSTGAGRVPELARIFSRTSALRRLGPRVPVLSSEGGGRRPVGEPASTDVGITSGAVSLRNLTRNPCVRPGE